MRERPILTIAILIGLMVAGAGRVQACEALVHLTYDEPVVLEGVLKAGSSQHDAQGAFKYTYLELDQGICVDAPKDADPDDAENEFSHGTPEPVTRIQIAGEALETALPIGARVKVEGALFGAHTMWHAEDVLIDATDVTPQ